MAPARGAPPWGSSRALEEPALEVLSLEGGYLPTPPPPRDFPLWGQVCALFTVESPVRATWALSRQSLTGRVSYVYTHSP